MNIRKSLSMLFVLCFIALPLLGQSVTNVRLWSLDYNSYLDLSWAENSSTNRTLSFYVSNGSRAINLAGNLTLSGNNRVATWAALLLNLYDSDSSNRLGITWDENSAADRTLKFYVNGGSRAINLTGDFTLSGNNQVGLWMVTSTLTASSTILQAASQYHNWGATEGVNGYGFRDNAGTMEVKNSGGAWAAIPSSAGAIPSGLIAIFDAACPSGWTRVSAWDGLFLRGAATYGGTGGASTHVHSVDPPITTTSGTSADKPTGTEATDATADYHTHTVNIAAFDSASGSSLPPYIDVVFCKKD